MQKLSDLFRHPMWRPEPDRAANSALAHFTAFANSRAPLNMSDYKELHAWSVDQRGDFWATLWDFCCVTGSRGTTVLDEASGIDRASFFPEAQLNFAENLLWRRGQEDAVVFNGEDKIVRRWSWEELRASVSVFQQFMLTEGVQPGDRIGAMMPNMPETLAIMLAAASIGAVFASCSPDFGLRGIVDRFGQIEPKLFFSTDGYWYGGKRIELADKLSSASMELGSVQRTVVIPYLGCAETVAAQMANAISYETLLAQFKPRALEFTRFPFDHPVVILFSSGTTGVPKCIVHRAGGLLLQHLKEHRLHCDIRTGDRVFYYTTCGWMMWNWLTSSLASGATLLLYDGSPFYPDGNVLFDYAQAESMTHFGTSAKFLETAAKAGLHPVATHDLRSLRAVMSTGSPLSPEGFSYVYEAIKPDVHLSSISGGSDIASCFVLGIPTEPVWRGEIQGPGLGMAVSVFDADGRAVSNEKGELVCTKAFPSMPLGFWNDPDQSRYRAAYFEKFAGVWHHGDYAEIADNGGFVIHGRSDATLNPGGVRIGTAEIYGQVERIAEVAEALCVGQQWDGDVRIVLFVRLSNGATLDDDLVARIKLQIRTGATPRHVPAKIIAVEDIPRTKSGKITELAVREIIEGREVSNRDALANPDALNLYRNLPELARA